MSDVVEVRRAGPADEPWIRSLLDDRWGGQVQVSNGEAYRPAELPGLLASIDGAIVGYAALRPVERCGRGRPDRVAPAARRGVGSALIDALVEPRRTPEACRSLRAVTTNDNLGAQAFYRASGIRPGRRPGSGRWTGAGSIKPQIPLGRPATARRSAMNSCSNEPSEPRPGTSARRTPEIARGRAYASAPI